MNAPAKIETPTGLALLRQPFPDHHISKLPKPYKKDSPKGNCKECGGYHALPAVHLDYVGHAALTDRLLDADPNWYWEPVAFGDDGLPAFDRIGGLWIRLNVCGHTRLGYGHPDGKTGGNAIKEAIGDALRNAAMRFGAALDLWHKGDLHLDDDAPTADEGQSQQGAVSPPADIISDDQLVKLQMLIKATSTSEIAFLRAMGAPDGAKICELPKSLFPDAEDKLNKKLAKLAADQTNKKAQGFGEILEDEVTY